MPNCYHMHLLLPSLVECMHFIFIFIDFCSQTRESLVPEHAAQLRGRLILAIKIQQDNHYHPYELTPQIVEYKRNDVTG